MWWLSRRLRRQQNERGAVAALVAILFAVGVITTLAALVVDGGQIYAARAQLQNGADAAALAIAQACAAPTVGTACATDPGNMTTTAYAAANAYATKNAVGGAGHITLVCGSLAVFHTVCPARDPSNPLICPTTPTSGNWVEVHTETGADSSSRLLPPVFGKTVMGGSYAGKAYGACAQVAWGPVQAATAAAITFSLCTWNAATNNGSVFAAAPPYTGTNPWPPGPAYPRNNYDPTVYGVAGGEQVLASHGTGNDCSGNLGSGWNYPGGFGWLSDPGNNCQSYVDVTNQYAGLPGNSPDTSCNTYFQSAANAHSVIYLPIFDGLSANGANGTYHLSGFAAFVLTGGYWPGGGWSSPSSVSGRNYCNGSYRCLYGYFVHGLIPASQLFSSGGTTNGAVGVDVFG